MSQHQSSANDIKSLPKFSSAIYHNELDNQGEQMISSKIKEARRMSGFISTTKNTLRPTSDTLNINEKVINNKDSRSPHI